MAYPPIFYTQKNDFIQLKLNNFLSQENKNLFIKRGF